MSIISLIAVLVCLACRMPVAYAEEATPPVITVPTTPLSASADGDYVVGPEYANAPELTAKDGVPKGVVKTFKMGSKDSKMYPGISKAVPGTVPYTRRVAVYIPKQYVPGTPAPLMVCQDASNQKELPTILDNMIHDHRLPVMIAVFITSGGGDGKGSERGLEYDTVSGKYAEFVESEVLPKIAADYHITFTKDPDARATYGCSSGGAAAFTMAWFHPELYHRVLTYSGTYVNQQSAVAARSLGISRAPDPRLRRQAAAGLDGSRRKRQPLHRSRIDAAQLGPGQLPHGRRPQGQGVSLSICVRQGRQARRWPRRAANFARSAGMAVAGVFGQVIVAKGEPGCPKAWRAALLKSGGVLWNDATIHRYRTVRSIRRRKVE
jgi:hypothetical protein